MAELSHSQKTAPLKNTPGLAPYSPGLRRWVCFSSTLLGRRPIGTPLKNGSGLAQHSPAFDARRVFLHYRRKNAAHRAVTGGSG